MSENENQNETTAATPPAAGEARGRRKTRVGVVVSDRMQKTIVVGVVRRVPHPRFGKIVKKTTRLYADDPKGEAKTGDRVRIQECRPLSKLKRWRLIEVLKH
jgi:small subunit ribosomal protein S17